MNTIPTKVPTGIDLLLLKFVWKCKGPKIARIILK